MSAHDSQEWYYVTGGRERLGPVSIRELSARAGAGEIGPESLVWSQSLPDWVPAAQIADLLSAARLATAADPEISAPVTVPASPAPVEAPAAPAGGSDTGEASEPSAVLREIKPRKGSFLFPRLVVGVCFSLLAGGTTAAVLAAMENPAWPGLLVFAAAVVLAVVAGLAAYRKERYEIQDGRVLCHRGGLVSDETTELEVRKITHVKLKLPWLRHKFFGVGDVTVETAGNARPVVMRAIREPEAVFAGLRERMRQHGYDLSQRELLHEEQPAIVGILGECLGAAFGVGLTVLFLVPALADARKGEDLSLPGFVLPVALAVAAAGLVSFIVLRVLDYRRRFYRVYNDVVVYEEGFLTRHDAFIPYENIADANTKRTIIDQILGLYDVQVSCQGSSAEIKFRRLRGGRKLSDAIDRLVVFAREKPKPAARKADPNHAARVRPRRHEPEAVPLAETLVADLRMNPTRTLVPLLFLLPLFPIWIAAMIQAGIRLMSTRYAVRPGSLRHSYQFLTVNDREFAYDKITGLVIKQNLWDRMFGTMTLRFWSLGSGRPLEFSHVSARLLDLPALMRQAGIPAESLEPHEAKASFGVLTWLRARLKFLPLLLLAAAGIVFAALEIDPLLYYLFVVPAAFIIGGCLYARFYCDRQRLRFHEHHVEAVQGIIATRRYFARYGNIKRSRVTRYPGGGEGDLQIFVAGEEEVQSAEQQKKGTQKILRPCSFTSRFLPDAREAGLLLDDILCGRVEPTPQAVAAEPLEVLMETRRSVGVFLVELVLTSIVLLPLAVLLPVSLPLAAVWVKRWRYRVEAARIVTSWGLLYRSESSILLDRVDSLQQSQGPLNKMFRNGNVQIMTAGSSKPDLKLVDSPDYRALYELIREHSE